MAEPKIYVKPAISAETGKPQVAYHPSAMGTKIPGEGAFVPHDLFTKRRLRDGDWTEATPPGEAKAPAKPKAAAAES